VRVEAVPSFEPPALPAARRPVWAALDGAAAPAGGAALMAAPLAIQLVEVVRDLEKAGLRFMAGDWKRDDLPRWMRHASGQDGVKWASHAEAERKWAEAHQIPAEQVAGCLLAPKGKAPQLWVDGADMGETRFPVGSLDDLQTLDGFYVTGQKNGRLAAALDHMGALGLSFFKPLDGGAPLDDAYAWHDEGDSQRPAGRYGALQLLEGKVDASHDPLADAPLLVGFTDTSRGWHGWEWKYDLPLATAEGAIAASYARFHGKDAEYDASAPAPTARRMMSEGCTFHGARGSALPLERVLAGETPLTVGVGGYPIETVDRLDAIGPRTREITSLYGATLKPLVDSHRLNRGDVGWFVRTASIECAIPTFGERWMLLARLAEARGWQASPHDDYEFLRHLPGAGTDMWRGRDVPRYLELVKQCGDAQTAQNRFAEEALVRWLAPAKPHEAGLCKDFLSALAEGNAPALDAARGGASGPLRARLQLVTDIYDGHVSRALPQKPAPKLSAGEETLRDFLAAARFSSRVEDGARDLQRLTRRMGPYETGSSCRELFAFLEEGVREDRFGGRAYARAVDDLVEAYLATHQVDEARGALLTNAIPRPPQGWTWDDDVDLYRKLSLGMSLKPGIQDDGGRFWARMLMRPLSSVLTSAMEADPAGDGALGSEAMRDFALALSENDGDRLRELQAQANGRLKAIMGLLVGLLIEHAATMGPDSTRAVGQETLKDFEAIVAHQAPCGTFEDALERLNDVQRCLAEREGAARCREVFAFLQDGLRDGLFGDRSYDELIGELASSKAFGQSSEAVRERLLAGPKVAGAISRTDQQVDINGIRVEVRRPG
jgi:hypothetical protein